MSIFFKIKLELPLINVILSLNFFEGRATEYSKASTQGTWVEAFS